MTPSSASETFQRGVQNLQAWLDFLAEEEAKLQAQLAKMQGGTAIPEIDADLPSHFANEIPEANPNPTPEKAEDADDWL
jgi:hypothetical protein